MQRVERPLGSDLPKQEEQLGDGIVKEFPWNFSQNGLVAYKDGELQEVQTLAKHLGEDNVKRIVNWVLAYLSKVDIPIKVRNWKASLAVKLCRSHEQVFLARHIY